MIARFKQRVQHHIILWAARRRRQILVDQFVAAFHEQGRDAARAVHAEWERCNALVKQLEDSNNAA